MSKGAEDLRANLTQVLGDGVGCETDLADDVLELSAASAEGIGYESVNSR